MPENEFRDPELRFCDNCEKYWDAIEEQSGECCPECMAAGLEV